MSITRTEEVEQAQLDADYSAKNMRSTNKKKKATWPSLRAQLHDRIIDGATNKELSEHFGVSARTISAWKRTLARELLANENLDGLTWISERISTFKMLRAEAWQNYHRAETDSQRLKWFLEIMKAETELNNLLISSGALDEKPLSPANLRKRMVVDHANGHRNLPSASD